MLHERKQCEDPIEHKILNVNVKVLADGLFVDDAQTLESAGLLNTETEVTVIYPRNEVEGATRWGIHVEGLLRVNIPSSLGALKCDNQVVKVAIPKSVTAIGNSAFRECSSLVRITIPESVTAIGDHGFARCCSLESIIIPESVTAIGNGVFHNCSSLGSITIPKSVTHIGECAFNDKLQVERRHVWLWYDSDGFLQPVNLFFQVWAGFYGPVRSKWSTFYRLELAGKESRNQTDDWTTLNVV